MKLARQGRSVDAARLMAASSRAGALALALALLALACGGQSGAEGTADPTPSKPQPGLPGPGSSCYEPDVEELPFDATSIEELANGRHETTFRWGEIGIDGTALPLIFEVQQRSPSQTSKRCGGVSAYNADVVVELPGKRTATFKGWVQGSSRGAFVSANAGTSVRSALAIPGPALTGEDHPGYRVIAHIDENAASGELMFSSGSTGECTAASWPADRSCPLFQREAPSDSQFGDFSFADVHTRLAAREYTVRWKDGSSAALELSVESDESPVCVAHMLGDRQPDGTQPDRLSQFVRLHVRTSDGRLDVVVPAMLAVLWSEDTGVVTVSAGAAFGVDNTIQLSARVIGHFAGAEGDEFATLELAAAFGPEAASGAVYLATVGLTHPPAWLEAGGAVGPLENSECWGISHAGGDASTATGTLE